jgi:hypothetical protein
MRMAVNMETMHLMLAPRDEGSVFMPRDPELMSKLAEVAGKRPENVSLQELIEMCVLLERHEDEQHREYGRIALKEGYPEIAAIFDDLAQGEKFYFEKMVKKLSGGKQT